AHPAPRAGFFRRAARASLVVGVGLAGAEAIPAPVLADRTITTPIPGPVFSDGGFLTVTSSGSITSPNASGVGVSVSGGLPIPTLTNDGVIQVTADRPHG